MVLTHAFMDANFALARRVDGIDKATRRVNHLSMHSDNCQITDPVPRPGDPALEFRLAYAALPPSDWPDHFNCVQEFEEYAFDMMCATTVDRYLELARQWLANGREGPLQRIFLANASFGRPMPGYDISTKAATRRTLETRMDINALWVPPLSESARFNEVYVRVLDDAAATARPVTDDDIAGDEVSDEEQACDSEEEEEAWEEEQEQED